MRRFSPLAFFALFVALSFAQEEEELNVTEELSYVSTSTRVVVALLFLVLAAAALGLTLLYWFRSKSDIKFLTASIFLFTFFRGVFTFISDESLSGNKGVWRLFLNLPSEIGFVLSISMFLSFFGYWLCRNRNETPATANTETAVFGMIREFIADVMQKIATKEGIFFVVSVVLTLLFTLLGLIIGSSVEPMTLSVYFEYNLIIVSSGLAMAAFAVFGMMYPTRFFHSVGLSLLPFVRLLLAFISVVQGHRIGNYETVSTGFIIITIIFEIIPMIALLIAAFLLASKMSALSQKSFIEPMLSSRENDDNTIQT